MAVIGKATDWSRTHRAEAIAACQDTTATVETCNVTFDVETSSKNPFTWSSTGRLNTDAIQKMIPFLPSDIAKTKNMTAEDFADTSIAGGGS